MRLFTAIDLSDELRASIESLQSKLKPIAPIQWSHASNLHITTKFIGEWPQDRLDELIAALQRIPPVGPIEIEVSQIGWYPDAREPRVLWAGVRATQALYDLAKATGAAAAELGVPAEKHDYSPHLTLARIRNSQTPGPLLQAVAGLEPQQFGRFAAARYHLYLSKPSCSGSRYCKISDFSIIP